jgi:hypothetical protein
MYSDYSAHTTESALFFLPFLISASYSHCLNSGTVSYNLAQQQNRCKLAFGLVVCHVMVELDQAIVPAWCHEIKVF